MSDAAGKGGLEQRYVVGNDHRVWGFLVIVLPPSPPSHTHTRTHTHAHAHTHSLSYTLEPNLLRNSGRLPFLLYKSLILINGSIAIYVLRPPEARELL